MTRNTASIPIPCCLGSPGSVAPVYDVFRCRGNLQIAMIGPYYTRNVMLETPICMDGERVRFHIEDDPSFFTMTLLADVPPRLVDKESIGVRFAGTSVQVHLQDREHCGTLAIATMVKFDWPWIAEWIEHHRKLGIEHFYIYNNGDHRVSDAIRRFVGAGLATEIAWEYPCGHYSHVLPPFLPADAHWYAQPPHMMHAVLKYGHNWSWMGFIDCDEFLVPMDGRKLSETLSPGVWRCDMPGKRVGALLLKGKWFGNSGHHERVLPVLDSYRRCERGHTSPPKCFIAPLAAKASRVHYWTLDGDTVRVDPEVLRFNHYRGLSGWTLRAGPEHDGIANDCTDDAILKM